jgi:hypothetical protein
MGTSTPFTITRPIYHRISVGIEEYVGRAGKGVAAPTNLSLLEFHPTVMDAPIEFTHQERLLNATGVAVIRMHMVDIRVVQRRRRSGMGRRRRRCPLWRPLLDNNTVNRRQWDKPRASDDRDRRHCPPGCDPRLVRRTALSLPYARGTQSGSHVCSPGRLAHCLTQLAEQIATSRRLRRRACVGRL